MEPVRVALVGCGKVGGIHASALKSLPIAEFVAACDASPDRARAFADRFGASPFSDLEEMFTQAKPEVLLIGTPHPLHAQSTIAAAKAGVNVLIEKPMAASLADCDAMLRAAGDHGVVLGVISQRRWFESVLRVKQAIAAGKIGRPALGMVTMLSWRDEAYYRSDPWRGRWDTEGGGVLVNQAPHHLDLLRWMMGEIEEISGAWTNVNHPFVEVEDTAVATLRFKGGGLGSIVVSLAQKPGIYTKIHIHGTSGASVGVETDRGATFIAGMTGIAEPPLNDLWTVPGEEDALARFEAEDRARFATIDPTVVYHAHQIEDFLLAVRQKRPPMVTGLDGREVVAIFTAIYRSQAERRPIRMEELAFRNG